MFDVTVYVVHAAHLADRKQHMMGLLKLLAQEPRLQVRINFVTQHDPKDISAEDIKTLVDLNKTNDKDDPWDAHVRNMHINQVSNALKHMRCVEAIAAAPEDARCWYLVLEDDVCFTREAGAMLADVCDKLTGDRRVDGPLLLGLPSDAPAGTPFAFRPVLPTFPLLPSCESYLLRPAGARRLLAGLTPVRFVATKQLPWAAFKTETPLWACAPNVFSDGSKVGRFVSTQNPTNRLVYNADYVTAFQALAADAEKARGAASALAASPVAPHPDAMHLLAKLTARCGDHAAALEWYKKADDIYTRAGAIVNGESEFLRDYIEHHKHLQ